MNARISAIALLFAACGTSPSGTPPLPTEPSPVAAARSPAERVPRKHGTYARLDVGSSKRSAAEATMLANHIADELRGVDPTKLASAALTAGHCDDCDASYGEIELAKGELGERLALMRDHEVAVVPTKDGSTVLVHLPDDPIENADVFDRAPAEETVWVYPVYIEYLGLPGTPDRRRTETQVHDDVARIAKVMRDDATDLAALVRSASEDRDAHTVQHPVDLDSDFLDYTHLGRRLAVGEVAISREHFGFWIVKRVPPPEPDPEETVSVLQRTTVADRVAVKRIRFAWTDAHAGAEYPAATRTRQEMTKLLDAALARVLETPASFDEVAVAAGDKPLVVEVKRHDPTFQHMRDLAIRLKVGEVGVVRTNMGMEIIERVE